MKKINHIPAFTIFEVLIAMAISGVIVMLAVGLYLTLLRHIQQNTDSATHYRQMAGFTSTIARDFGNSNYILAHSDYELECFFYKHSCIYFFEEDYVLRFNDSNTDTFHLQTTIPVFSFHDEKPEFLIKLEFDILKDTYSRLPVLLQKNYPVKYLLMEQNYAPLPNQ